MRDARKKSCERGAHEQVPHRWASKVDLDNRRYHRVRLCEPCTAHSATRPPLPRIAGRWPRSSPVSLLCRLHPQRVLRPLVFSGGSNEPSAWPLNSWAWGGAMIGGQGCRAGRGGAGAEDWGTGAMCDKNSRFQLLSCRGGRARQSVVSTSDVP